MYGPMTDTFDHASARLTPVAVRRVCQGAALDGLNGDAAGVNDAGCVGAASGADAETRDAYATGLRRRA